MNNEKQWFTTWFNSPYYHILYKHRDYAEAQKLIDQLALALHFQPQQRFLDLACGKGRHALYLHQKGFEVVGIDLSEESIRYARQFEEQGLAFYTHDMREVFRPQGFDFVLNLFTSFGYFDSHAENLQALDASAANLKAQGRLVIDFLNPHTTIRRLVAEEQQHIEGITFYIKRYLEEDFIVKDIRFEAEGTWQHFQERVRAITYQDFLTYFEEAQLQVCEVWGNYALQSFEEETSDRMIFVLEKK